MADNKRSPARPGSPEDAAITSAPARVLDGAAIRSMREQLVYGATNATPPISPPGSLGDKVGYKSPPKHSRFKPGQSGNPKGRPKKRDPKPSCGLTGFYKTILDQARRSIPVREGDRLKNISVFEAIIRAQHANALKGNSRAQHDVLVAIQHALEQERQSLDEEHRFWAQIRDNKRRELDLAEMHGLDEADIIPHPDDIIIEPGQPVRIIGPIDDGGAKRMEETIRLRDQLILQYELDVRGYGLDVSNASCGQTSTRSFGSISKPSPMLGFDGGIDKERFLNGYDDATAYILAMLLESTLPKRRRLSEDQWWHRLARNRFLQKRDLEKRVFQGWKALGCHKHRRGQLSPPWSSFGRILGFLSELVSAITSAEIDLDAALGSEGNTAFEALAEKWTTPAPD